MPSRRVLIAVAALFVTLAGGAFFLQRDLLGTDMTRAASAFVKTLSEQQVGRVVLPFDDKQRLDWHFIPKNNRKGLQIKDMTPEQHRRTRTVESRALTDWLRQNHHDHGAGENPARAGKGS